MTDMPPPSPRPFPFRAVSAGTKFLLLFGGIWLGVGLLLTIIFTLSGGPVWNDWILDERGKKVWELIICDPARQFEHAQYLPNNKINSGEVGAAKGHAASRCRCA